MPNLLTAEFSEPQTRSSCGTGFVAEISGRPSRRVVTLALQALQRLSHRGARGADEATGDGAGILVGIPHDLFRRFLDAEPGRSLEPGEELAVGMVFTTAAALERLESAWIAHGESLGLRPLGRRLVPVEPEVLGATARASRPQVVQLFAGCPRSQGGPENPERPTESTLYLLRKRIERSLADDSSTFFCSLSARTIVYKGLLTSHQLAPFYPDLRHPEFISTVAVFHERFATNTLPDWSLAQPFRMVAHNGEFNTIQGNRLWMEAREGEMRSAFWEADLDDLKPIIEAGGSDSLSFDNALEFLRRSGRELCTSAMILVPDPHFDAPRMPPELRDFFIYHENLMEPWDGPAALVFTDGETVAAKLDRNGLRPLRYTITRDDLAIMASEAGVVDVDDEDLLLNHHMTSGEIFSLRLDGSGLRGSDPVKREAARSAPYSELVRHSIEAIDRLDVDAEFGRFELPEDGFDRRLRVAHGWSREDLDRFLLPMAQSGREPMGSMGDDTPPAVLSRRDRRLYDYFKQSFAQVTNPPIDPIRESFVTSLVQYLGSEDNLLATRPRFQGAIRIAGPVLSPRELSQLEAAHDRFGHATIRAHSALEQDLEIRIEEIRAESVAAVSAGSRILFLSDEGLEEGSLPLPMPLVVAAVHHELIRRKVRSAVSLVCRCGDVASDHHLACLMALGASAVYPYLAYELLREHYAEHRADRSDWMSCMGNYRYALEKGLLKILAKMGISTLHSYHGAMTLYALGLSDKLRQRFFPAIAGRLGGIDLEHIHANLRARHDRAFRAEDGGLEDLGLFRYRRGAEQHGLGPARFQRIQRLGQGNAQQESPAAEAIYIRDLLEPVPSAPLPLLEVEPEADILRRFGAGAMSLGAVSDEAHRALARGFHLVGGRSNSGEGGETADRYAPGSRDPGLNCWVKQVASGRFGVTTDYLAAARELQIKIAQGAKPGEGGQLPGHKVSLEIAGLRGSTPGVPLISPPPHHDIYSIEDLAQLIYDLGQVNPRCDVSVKLVAQPGIGTIACGVAKAGADVILVSGGDGGTGASPLGSMKSAGFPWEPAVVEVHGALVAAGLRDRVRLRVDGGLRGGADILAAALLGAEEFDFGTAALVALGCVMARQCHLNTCPTGIATQDEALRRRFRGRPENLARYLQSVAGEVREGLARLGAKRLESIVGRSERLRADPEFEELIEARGVDLESLLRPALPIAVAPASRPIVAATAPARTVDEGILDEVHSAILTHGQAVVHRRIRNVDRSVGTRIAGELAFLYGRGGFRGNIQIRLRGTAGQSLGAFLTDGLELRLRGMANDYVAKGMSGGLVTVRLPRRVRETGHLHTVLGNVALYGATGGTLLVAGRAGERFAVRNSGATAVVEGVGNHCCEYMTRGVVVVLGEIGRNFGAGMTGGTAFIYSPHDPPHNRLNNDFVRSEELSGGDESLLQRLLRRHLHHCSSTLTSRILDGWQVERAHFVKLVPVALDILDFQEIYDQQMAARMGVLLNE